MQADDAYPPSRFSRDGPWQSLRQSGPPRHGAATRPRPVRAPVALPRRAPESVAPAGPASARSEIDRMQAQLRQSLVAKLAGGDETFPIFVERGIAAAAVAAPCIEEVGGRGVVAEAETGIGLRGEHFDRIVLEDVVAETVED